MIYLLSPQDSRSTCIAKLLRENDVAFEAQAACEVLAPIQSRSAGCVIVPWMSGDEAVASVLRHSNANLTSIALITSGDVFGAIASRRAGAFDCIAGPFDRAEVLAVVSAALDESARRIESTKFKREMEEKLQRLSDREREVVPLICEGFSNKQVAMKLNISIKTVAHHRAQVLKKTAARNTADMVRLVTRANSFGDMTFTRHQ